MALELDVVVIGAGPGGYTAAIRAAQLGKKVTVIEKENLGGVCLNVGCIPSKALISAAEAYQNVSRYQEMGIEIDADHVKLNYAKVQKWKRSVIDRLTGGVSSLLKGHQIEVIQGEARFVSKNEIVVTHANGSDHYHFQDCILAAGSRPMELPDLPFSQRVLSSTAALNLEEVPKRLAVVGGGYIGIELGQAFAKFGTKVTILEGGASILPGFDKRLVSTVNRNLKKANVDVYTKAFARHCSEKNHEVTVTFEAAGEEKQLTADYVLVTVGRKPNTDQLGLEAAGIQVNDKKLIAVDRQCRTNVSHIYAIGDIVPGPALAHKASYEGKAAAEVIAGRGSVVDYRCIPAVVFSDPEIAVVGVLEKEANDQGIETRVGKFSYAANGRALSLHAAEGSVTLIADKKEGVVIGAQIVGPEASNLIAEVGLAIEMGATLEDVALTIHAHPTLGEMIMEAAENALGLGIHSM
ncbi:dihydrolipoyl dehydrogenase [Paenibacillus naphthalenovorans]|uniref:Dihydrolipoyl dehydrogenase n=1 Tax=Paenibacillus naphthalenovorans TaxID=162209 RepID=A0A0U2UCJ0_9BACL|nr:dihydrolipoyl dehydrogenase [Paenibacillus naphthalenovorans]ALS23960.1 dihydrolipoamide dehydrogenase [Paenibacillus naphthalenovorans]GCL72190.1 dihydrolipoyl dehydrogenase [Paenibacillus naphthalenovorans]